MGKRPINGFYRRKDEAPLWLRLLYRLLLVALIVYWFAIITNWHFWASNENKGNIVPSVNGKQLAGGEYPRGRYLISAQIPGAEDGTLVKLFRDRQHVSTNRARAGLANLGQVEMQDEDVSLRIESGNKLLGSTSEWAFSLSRRRGNRLPRDLAVPIGPLATGGIVVEASSIRAGSMVLLDGEETGISLLPRDAPQRFLVEVEKPGLHVLEVRDQIGERRPLQKFRVVARTADDAPVSATSLAVLDPDSKVSGGYLELRLPQREPRLQLLKDSVAEFVAGQTGLPRTFLKDVLDVTNVKSQSTQEGIVVRIGLRPYGAEDPQGIHMGLCELGRLHALICNVSADRIKLGESTAPSTLRSSWPLWIMQPNEETTIELASKKEKQTIRSSLAGGIENVILSKLKAIRLSEPEATRWDSMWIDIASILMAVANLFVMSIPLLWGIALLAPRYPQYARVIRKALPLALLPFLKGPCDLVSKAIETQIQTELPHFPLPETGLGPVPGALILALAASLLTPIVGVIPRVGPWLRRLLHGYRVAAAMLAVLFAIQPIVVELSHNLAKPRLVETIAVALLLIFCVPAAKAMVQAGARLPGRWQRGIRLFLLLSTIFVLVCVLYGFLPGQAVAQDPHTRWTNIVKDWIQRLSNILPFAISLPLFAALAENRARVQPDYQFERGVGSLLFAGIIIGSAVRVWWVPIPLLLGLFTSRLLFVSLAQSIVLRRMSESDGHQRRKWILHAFDALRGKKLAEASESLDKKLGSGDLKLEEYRERQTAIENEVEHINRMCKIGPGMDMRMAALGAPLSPDPLSNAAASLHVAWRLAAILLTFYVITLPQTYSSLAQINIADMVANVGYVLGKWFVTAAFFGFFYCWLGGDSGLNKGFRFVLVVTLCFAPTWFIFVTEPGEARQIAMTVVRDLLLICTLCLFAFDLPILRTAYGKDVPIRSYLRLNGIGGVAAYTSLVIAALGTALTSIVTSNVGDFVKWIAAPPSISRDIGASQPTGSSNPQSGT